MKINKTFYAVLLSFSGMIVAAPGTPTDPGFDMMNKSGKDVTVAVYTDGINVAHGVVKQATTFFGKTITPKNFSVIIDTDKQTQLNVYEGTYPDMRIDPKATQYTYHFTKGKKIYVTLDPNGALRPQVGVGNKTATGYSKENEVTQADIMRQTENNAKPANNTTETDPEYERACMILGVQPGADYDTIKKAYNKLALKWHPDKWTTASLADQENAKRMFQTILDAYEYLIK